MRNFRLKMVLFLVLFGSIFFSQSVLALGQGSVEVKCCKDGNNVCFLQDVSCGGGNIEMALTVCVIDEQLSKIKMRYPSQASVTVNCLDDEKRYFTNSGKYLSAHGYEECKITVEGATTFLPGKLIGTSNEYNLFFDGVTCKVFEKYANKSATDDYCSTNNDCPFGTECQDIQISGNTVKGCEIHKCATDGGCNPSLKEKCSIIGVNINKPNEINVGICIRELTLEESKLASENKFCFCSQGQQGCTNPTFFCTTFSGEKRCDAGTCKTTDQIVAGACGTSKDCWDKCLMNCCDSATKMCTGKMDYACQNSLANTVGRCPPYFSLTHMGGSASGLASVCTEPSCGSINDDFKRLMQKNPPCNKDADCAKFGPDYECSKKEGYKVFTFFANFLDLTGRESNCGGSITGSRDSAAKYFYDKCVTEEKGERMLWTCQKKIKLAEPDYQGEVFSIPSIARLSQLRETDLSKIIGNLIKIALGFIGSIALAMFVYGGLLWMTAMGNSENQKKAMNIILWSALGVLVILSSYMIVSFVLRAFGA